MTNLEHHVIKENGHPVVLISAGIHGDEPAGTNAAEYFIRHVAKNYLDRFSFVILPRINPRGLQRCTRLTPDGHDINRSFKEGCEVVEVLSVKRYLSTLGTLYIAAIDLHEDNVTQDNISPPFPTGFYLYEVSKSYHGIGGRVSAKIAKQFPVHTKDFVYSDSSQKGVVWSRGVCDPFYKDHATMEGFVQRYTDRAFTLETLTSWTMEERVACHTLAITTILDQLSRNVFLKGYL